MGTSRTFATDPARAERRVRRARLSGGAPLAHDSSLDTEHRVQVAGGPFRRDRRLPLRAAVFESSARSRSNRLAISSAANVPPSDALVSCACRRAARSSACCASVRRSEDAERHREPVLPGHPGQSSSRRTVPAQMKWRKSGVARPDDGAERDQAVDVAAHRDLLEALGVSHAPRRRAPRSRH